MNESLVTEKISKAISKAHQFVATVTRSIAAQQPNPIDKAERDYVLLCISSEADSIVSDIECQLVFLHFYKVELQCLECMLVVFFGLDSLYAQAYVDHDTVKCKSKERNVRICIWETMDDRGRLEKTHSHYGLEIDTQMIFFQDKQEEAQSQRLTLDNWLKLQQLVRSKE